jgi:Lrp/AsnC family transcriptional regulator, leucine-responsive regulatory protein
MEKIDKRDRILLYELSKNCRQSYSTLAKKAGISKQMVHYRVNRLIKLKILRETLLTVDVGKLGYLNYVIYFQWNSRQREKELIAELLKNTSIRYASDGTGKINFVVTFNARSPMEFQRMWDSILSRYAGAIRVYSIQAITEYRGFESSAIVGGEEREAEGSCLITGEKRVSVDELDKRILKVLCDNARAPLADIASKARSSPDTVRGRMRRMEDEGLIQAYQWMYDLRAVGLRWYEVPVSLADMTKEAWDSLYGYCRSNPRIILFVRSIGKFDLMVLFEVGDDAEFDSEIKMLHERFSKNIRDFDIMKVENIYKFRFLDDPRL